MLKLRGGTTQAKRKGLVPCLLLTGRGDFFYNSVERFGELMEVGRPVVDIADANNHTFIVLTEKGNERLFAVAPAFAHQTFGAVAVHGVVQTPLRGHNEHLHPRWYRAIGDKHPINAKWEGHKFARRLVEARNNTAVAESFCLMECIGSQKETY